MPLDHFISQVHLKNFYTNDERGRLVAIRKDDLKKFYPRSEDVCRREHGSTNKYLSEPRAIEIFLKNIEPNYNISVEAIRQKAPGTKDVYVIAGFIAYIMACSPTGMRITRGPIAAAVQSTAEILDAQGRFPPAPTAFGGKSMTELLSDGLVQLKIDDKIPAGNKYLYCRSLDVCTR